MHDIIPDYTDFIEKPRQRPTVNFQVEFRPEMRVLQEAHVLPK